MAKPLPTTTNSEVPRHAAAALKNSLTGHNPHFDPSKYKVRGGRERAASPDRPFFGLLIGESGTGKTYSIVGLLRLGFKVMYFTTDYGKQGLETMDSYFVDHPEERYLLNNFREIEGGLDFDGIQEFGRFPERIVPDIFEWDPDWIFWDGLTSYQELMVQSEKVSDDDYHKNNWSDWHKQKAGVNFPMDRFLCLHNRVTGRVWNKLVTCGIKEKEKYRAEKRGEEWVQVPIEGSKKRGADLNTSVQQLIRFGFSLVLESTRRVIGKDEVFGFTRVAVGLETKSRGYNSIPAVWEGKASAPVGFYELWREHIAAKHAPFTVPSVKETSTETVLVSPASIETQGEKE